VGKHLKHLIDIEQMTTEQVDFMMYHGRRLKEQPSLHREALKGLTLGLIFEKPSTRTWASFHTGAAQLGADVLYLGPTDIALGKREETKDIARVLSSYVGGFVLRTFKHSTITEFAKYSATPVINGLSDYSHPCQALSDLFTIIERFGEKELKKLKITYVGDANNVLTSLMVLAALTGLKFTYATPKEYRTPKNILALVNKLAKKSKAKVAEARSPKEAVRSANVVYTDVWVSMGEEAETEAKKKHFKGFQVNKSLLKTASKDLALMHCLPAHRGEEITDDVLEGKNSVVFEQAANRQIVQKAILLYLLTPMGKEWGSG